MRHWFHLPMLMFQTWPNREISLYIVTESNHIHWVQREGKKKVKDFHARQFSTIIKKQPRDKRNLTTTARIETINCWWNNNKLTLLILFFLIEKFNLKTIKILHWVFLLCTLHYVHIIWLQKQRDYSHKVYHTQW